MKRVDNPLYQIFSAFSCKKDSFNKVIFIKDRRCFMRCLSFFYVSHKGTYSNTRDKEDFSKKKLLRISLCFGSFLTRKINNARIR